MRKDPLEEIICDGDGCKKSVFLPLEGYVGGFRLVDDDTAGNLLKTFGWRVDGDDHYCESCKPK